MAQLANMWNRILFLVCTLMVLLGVNALAQESDPQQSEDRGTHTQIDREDDGSSELFLLVSSLFQDSQGSPSHGWVIYRTTLGDVSIMHIPPRSRSKQGTLVLEPAQIGEVRGLRTISEMPLAMAAIKQRFYFVTPVVEGERSRFHRVYSAQAVPSMTGDSWVLSPVTRLDTLPILKATGMLMDFLAVGDSLIAMYQLESGDIEFQEFAGDQWERVGSGLAQDTQYSQIAGRLVGVNRSSSSELWELSDDVDGAQSWKRMDWPAIDLTEHTQLISQGNQFIVVDQVDVDQVGASDLDNSHESITFQIRLWSRDGVFVVADDVNLPKGTHFVVMGPAHRLVGISPRLVEGIGNSEQDQSSLVIHELDLYDGSVLYSGSPYVVSPVSVLEFRFLVVMMILMMIGVLVLVMMPEASEAMGIPDGYQLADPGRRFVACFADLLIMCVLVGQFFGVRMIEIITLSVIVRSDSSWLVIPCTLIAGCAVMTLLEWVWGGTPGKLLMGIRLRKAQSGEPRRVKFWVAIVRNGIKWFMPPVAALAMVDPEMLHRGDRVTRSIVLMKSNPEQSEELEND